MREANKLQQGASLIELVFSIIIISLSLTGILTVMNQTVSRSANPIVQYKALTIAESSLESILSTAYASISLGNTNSAVDGYTVSVSVIITTVTGVTAKKVSVNVSGRGNDLDLVGYATNYNQDLVIYRGEKYD